MKVYQLPENIRGFIFDMDNTLYTNDAYARHQEEALVERLAETLGLDTKKMQMSVDGWRHTYADAHGGRRPSLGNTFLHGFGIPIETSIAWRRESLRPGDYLKKDEKLVATLKTISSHTKMAVVTNNPVLVAEKSLEILGVLDLFSCIVGLDSIGKSKPNPEAFQMAASKLGCQEHETVSIGDRFEVDLEPAMAIGMGGILVTGVEEVYILPETLSDRMQH